MTYSILTPFKRDLTSAGKIFLRKLPASIVFCAAIGFVSVPVFAQEPNLNEANLTFVGADIESVIKAIGHYTGTTFIIDPRVKGTINLVSEHPVTKEQAFSLLTSTLRLQGYAVVAANGFTKVLPESDGKLQAGPTQVAGINGDQIATQVFRLNYESAVNLITVLRPLISPNNTISVNQGNNSVVVTDYADNLKRIAKIIATLDVPGNSGVDVIPMKYAIASDVATLLLRMTEQATGPSDSGKINVMADSRTNAILLHAPSEARTNLLKALIDKLDQPTALPGNVHVVYLRNADAMKLAQTLRAIMASDSNSAGSASSSTGSSSFGGSSQGQYSQSRTSMSSGFGGSSSSGFGGSSGSSGFGGSGLGSSMGSSGSFGSNNSQSTLPSGGAGGFIQADSATNTLIITASETVYRNLRTVIEQLDARRAQVYIEALIIDVSTTDLDQFGVQWAGITGNSNTRIRVGGATSFDTAGQQSNIFDLAAAKKAGNALIPSNGLNVGLFSTKLGLGAIASALQSTNIANVLSVPTLTTLDNEEANVLVGQNVSFISGSYANTSAGTASGGSGTVSPFNTTERKDVGVILKVRPQISEGGSVKLDIYQEVSDVVPGTTSTDLVINKRSLETKVIVDDGEILVLGGLMGDTVTGTDDQVPILGDIPWLGNLFKYKKKTRQKRNLLIFLRPTVLRNQDQSNSVSVDRYDYMRSAVRTDNPDKPLLNLPSLSAEKEGILIPQTLLNRRSTSTRLDSNSDVQSDPSLFENSGEIVTQTPVTSPTEVIH